MAIILFMRINSGEILFLQIYCQMNQCYLHSLVVSSHLLPLKCSEFKLRQRCFFCVCAGGEMLRILILSKLFSFFCLCASGEMLRIPIESKQFSFFRVCACGAMLRIPIASKLLFFCLCAGGEMLRIPIAFKLFSFFRVCRW